MISRIVRTVRTGNGVFAWFRANSIIITFLLGQGLVFGGWMVTQELTDRQNTTDINYARDSIAAMKADIVRVDERGSRELPEVKGRLGQHEAELANDRRQIDDLVSHGSPVIAAEVKSLKEQQDRNIRAIDILRSDLNDHIRWDANNRNGVPLPPRRSTQ